MNTHTYTRKEIVACAEGCQLWEAFNPCGLALDDHCAILARLDAIINGSVLGGKKVTVARIADYSRLAVLVDLVTNTAQTSSLPPFDDDAKVLDLSYFPGYFPA